jgi:formate C-acetyltransferase
VKTPKYGNTDKKHLGTDVKIGNKNAAYLVKFMEEVFENKENYRGGKYRVGYWTMTNHAGFGRMMGASPSGRKKGWNFTSGITPVSGVTPSLSETLNSVSGLPVEYVPSGMAFNIKYTPPANGEPTAEDKNNFTGYMKRYFAGKKNRAGVQTHPGGMEIQFNVTDHKKFIEAHNNPENPKFYDLLVRVSGYTAYFKDLNPQMRMEIINRTEYNLNNGRYVDFKRFKLKD